MRQGLILTPSLAIDRAIAPREIDFRGMILPISLQEPLSSSSQVLPRFDRRPD
jgi:hypothetical protein